MDKSDQHTFSMARFEADRAKAQGKSLQTYSPIARALLILDEKELERMIRKFDLLHSSKRGVGLEVPRLSCPSCWPRSGHW